MDPFHTRPAFVPQPAATASEDTATASDNDATTPPTRRDPSPDIATEDATEDATPPRQDGDTVDQVSRPLSRRPQPVDRDAYTLTVEDVAVRLADEKIYRDPRTIQRWCKSGRLACILDSENGEKYLIEPESLEKIVATLLRDRDRQARHVEATPRQVPRPQGDMSREASGHVGTSRDDIATHAATEREARRLKEMDISQPEEHPASENGDLQTRIRELENELALAKADKQVREQMVEYLKDQFETMTTGALDRAERIGELQAENAQLRSQLEAPQSSTGGDSGNGSEGVEYTQ